MKESVRKIVEKVSIGEMEPWTYERRPHRDWLWGLDVEDRDWYARIYPICRYEGAKGQPPILEAIDVHKDHVLIFVSFWHGGTAAIRIPLRP